MAATSSPQRWEDVVARLVSERGDALIRYAFLVCGDRDAAADLVQDALVKTFGRLRNGFSVTRAEAYVRRAIFNTYLDSGRRLTRWRRIAHLNVQPEAIEADDARVDARLDLEARLGELAPRERACIVLRYYDDLTVDAIGHTLGISSGAVKRYLSDALAKLQLSVGRDDEGVPHAR